MKSISANHFSLIICIIYLSDGCLSDGIPPVSSNETIIGAETTNSTPVASTILPVSVTYPFTNNFTAENKSEDNTTSVPFKTTTPISDYTHTGNVTLKPKKLSTSEEEQHSMSARETAGFVAIGFLLISIFGYGAFVLWRRYLQNKYGNGQTLITEEVYDISDLRNFEI